MLNLWATLLLTFMKIGAFSFGGGYAMIPLIQKEMISNGWLTVQEVADIVAISEMTPGPFATNAATFAGIKTGGFIGAVFATLGVVLPSVIITLLVSRYFFGFQEKKGVQAVLWGIRPTVVALILAAAASIALSAFLGIAAPAFIQSAQAVDVVGVGICAAAFVAMRRGKVSPIIMVGICALLGVVVYYFLGLG